MSDAIALDDDDDSRRESLFDALEGNGMLEYGSFIPGEFVRRIIGLQMPDVGTRKQFADISLRELSAVDAVRERLLNFGKYIAASGDGYRILTPGENSAQIDRYLGHAQNKIRRARKLERTSQALTSGKPSTAAARLLMTEKSLRTPNN
jgi:hypothetical protein